MYIRSLEEKKKHTLELYFLIYQPFVLVLQSEGTRASEVQVLQRAGEDFSEGLCFHDAAG